MHQIPCLLRRSPKKNHQNRRISRCSAQNLLIRAFGRHTDQDGKDKDKSRDDDQPSGLGGEIGHHDEGHDQRSASDQRYQNSGHTVHKRCQIGLGRPYTRREFELAPDDPA